MLYMNIYIYIYIQGPRAGDQGDPGGGGQQGGHRAEDQGGCTGLTVISTAYVS